METLAILIGCAMILMMGGHPSSNHGEDAVKDFAMISKEQTHRGCWVSGEAVDMKTKTVREDAVCYSAPWGMATGYALPVNGGFKIEGEFFKLP